jgi:VanZ family protein
MPRIIEAVNTKTGKNRIAVAGRRPVLLLREIRVPAKTAPINNRHFFKYWLPVYLYAGLIFMLSSWASPPSGPKILYADKLLHLLEYAILGYLIARAASKTSAWKLSRHFRVFAVCAAVLYGFSDEFHQSFVPGREVEMLDVLADGIGAFLGQIFIRD